MLLPVKPQKSDPHPADRAPLVFKMRLPDSKQAERHAPYILHQLITSQDRQQPGEDMKSYAQVRSVMVTYNENEQDGAMALLNMMERLRISLLRDVVIGDQFELDTEAGVECLIYPEDTAPFYRGEMVTTWKLPSIKREVKKLWQ